MPRPGDRRRAASYVAEGLQVALADGLELACTMALEMARRIRLSQRSDPGGAEALEEFARTVTEAKDSALETAKHRRLDGQAL